MERIACFLRRVLRFLHEVDLNLWIVLGSGGGLTRFGIVSVASQTRFALIGLDDLLKPLDPCFALILVVIIEYDFFDSALLVSAPIVNL